MNTIKTLFCLIFLFLFTHTWAQVVNTEKLRLKEGKRSVTGEADLNFGLTRNKAGQTVRLGAAGRVELVRRQNRWLLVGGYNLSQFKDIDEPGSAPKNFTDNAFSQLRYNRQLNDWLTWEAFSQVQYDEIQQIDLRILAGTGARLRIIETDSSQLFFGLLYMFEYEASRNELENPKRSIRIFNDDHRFSTYLSAGFGITDQLTIDHVTYFQPKVSNFRDYRISSETSLRVKISGRLSFRTFFQLVYDTQPPLPVPNTMYVLSNGLSMSF